MGINRLWAHEGLGSVLQHEESKLFYFSACHSSPMETRQIQLNHKIEMIRLWTHEGYRKGYGPTKSVLCRFLENKIEFGKLPGNLAAS
jgi:hypothetical protein